MKGNIFLIMGVESEVAVFFVFSLEGYIIGPSVLEPSAGAGNIIKATVKIRRNLQLKYIELKENGSYVCHK